MLLHLPEGPTPRVPVSSPELGFFPDTWSDMMAQTSATNAITIRAEKIIIALMD